MALYKVLLYLVHCLLAVRTVFSNLLWKARKPLELTFGKRTIHNHYKHDSQSLKKLPLHVGLVVLEDDISYHDIANILVWCMALGISYMSVYDRAGNFKHNEHVLQQEINKKQKEQLGEEGTKFDINIRHSKQKKKEKGLSSNQVDIQLLSLEDGRLDIVNTTRYLSQAVRNRQFKIEDITPCNVDALMQESWGMPDPDLVIKFGTVDSLQGFMPWQIRLTEILSVPSHHSFNYKTFLMALSAYGRTEMRFGK